MASSIYIIGADGVNYHLAGTGQSYTGSGTPWTSQATSPYQLSMNDITGPAYTPMAPQPLDIYNGGPPFRVGADLSFRGYGNVTESFGLQMRASSHDNAVALLRLLRRALSTTLASRPPLLVVQPDGATSAVYYEVYSATVQELPAFINEEAGLGGAKILRALITWTRSPFGGNLGGWQTLINGVTVGNTGTGTPDNLESLGTSGTGDLIHEGGPLNVVMVGTDLDFTDLFIATCAGRDYLDRNDSLVTTSTTGESAAFISVGSGPDLSAFLTDRRLRLRVLGRVTNASSTLEVQVRIGNGVYVSPWVGSPGGDVLLDFGGADPRVYDRTIHTGANAAKPSVSVLRRSTTGASTTGTLDYLEFVFYYTFGVLRTPFPTGGNPIAIETFAQRSGVATLPIPTRGSGMPNGSVGALAFIGSPPIYLSGKYLYVAWRGTPNQIHDPSATATLTVTHAPLFHTLRGGG